jgi:uncharacterized protein YgiM (DUF1202 family)
MDTLTYLLARADELNVKVDYPRQPARTAVVTADALNVRSGPSTVFGIVGHLQQGEQVFILATIGNWAKIAEGRWVSLGYLKES